MANQSELPAVVSWSGGKDSCLAMWRAQQSGMAIDHLVTAMDESGFRSRSHGIPPELIAAQADALKIDIRFYDTSWKTYEEKFVALLKEARSNGVKHAIFGDIDLMAHREWEERVCTLAGLQAMLPLWNEPRLNLVHEFLALGFKALVVCVNNSYLPREFCGREFDHAFLADLPAQVDACGENGEFHTFVYDGPAFSTPVAFQRGEIVRYDAPPELGSGTYYFQELKTTVP